MNVHPLRINAYSMSRESVKVDQQSLKGNKVILTVKSLISIEKLFVPTR